LDFVSPRSAEESLSDLFNLEREELTIRAERSLDSLEEGRLTEYLDFMATEYYDDSVWSRRVLPHFPEYAEISDGLVDDPFQQDKLATWISDHEETLVWNGADKTFRIKK
jgi:hypothetical protein